MDKHKALFYRYINLQSEERKLNITMYEIFKERGRLIAIKVRFKSGVLIIITGACIAAVQDRTKFSSIKGNGSNKLLNIVFTIIHNAIIIKLQLPTDAAILSAILSPKVKFLV